MVHSLLLTIISLYSQFGWKEGDFDLLASGRFVCFIVRVVLQNCSTLVIMHELLFIVLLVI